MYETRYENLMWAKYYTPTDYDDSTVAIRFLKFSHDAQCEYVYSSLGLKGGDLLLMKTESDTGLLVISKISKVTSSNIGFETFNTGFVITQHVYPYGFIRIYDLDVVLQQEF